VAASIDNPVRTVADSIDEFYKLYPQPPVLPMYRMFLMDLLKQVHLTTVDTRFKYDAVFALGIWESYSGLMAQYDKLGGGSEVDKIWPAMIKSLGMDPEKVKGDAQAAAEWAKSTPPATILEAMGGATASDTRMSDAFGSIASSLYSQQFSVGLFKLMEYAGVEVTKGNVEEWAKAIKIPESKPASDLVTYQGNLKKLAAAEEMMREVEIREKKKLAERLEEKAKALAAKASAAAAEAKTD
jgi:photosystem II biogenesis protein Psp29